MNAKQLEEHLRPIDYFVVHATKDSYEAILAILAASQTPCGVGYHRDYGWFVLTDYTADSDGPELIWSQRSPP